MSAEPSMEEILSSIKRIIAEEGEGTQARGRRTRTAPQPIESEPEPEEVLELSDPMPAAAFEAAPEIAAPAPIRTVAESRRPQPPVTPHADFADQPAAVVPPQAHPQPPVPPQSPTQAQPTQAPSSQPHPSQAEPEPQAQPIRAAAVPTPMSEEPILSQRAAAASLGSLETLSKLLVKPEPDSDGTLEGLVREMLRPMLRDWLDTHLPEMVETLVAREIAKITSQMR